MNKYFWILGLILSTLTITSCNNDDDYQTLHYVARGIDSISMPDSARLGNRVEIRTHTRYKRDCQQFQTHGYDVVGNERTVMAWFIEYNNRTCGAEEAISPYFYFSPRNSGTYHFRFWAGQNEANEDVFITKDIVIYP
ncbi:MAG: hypothetical protein Q4G27_10845 [Flavobacteriaceae bacterium]|nr:hypothetical protein [Flavobacteriaceae bacterium]